MVELTTDDGLGASIEAIGGSPPTLAVSGDIDVAVSEWFRTALAEHLDAESGPLALDLRGVTFLDSSGLAALVTTTRAVEVKIVAASDVARRVIELSGLADVLHLTT